MPPSPRIPSHLQPYVGLPHDESLLLVTSTLGASANWLTIRFLCAALSNTDDGGAQQGHNVVLVSWMRECGFWKQEARKGGGLDLERLKREGRFAFVDGLSEACLDATAAGEATNGPRTTPSGPKSPALALQGRRGLAPAASRTVPAPAPAHAASAKQISPGHYALKSLDMAHLKATVTGAVSALSSSSGSQRKTLVVLDNPDLLLALDPAIKPSAISSLVLTLHDLPSVSHVLTHIQADNPLLSLSTPPQPLEIAHHNLLVKLGHMSRRILGVRVLDTGVARDVSGVIRVTEQRMDWRGLGFKEEEKARDDAGKGKEFLYQVKGDGSVKVFDRGAGGDA